MWPLALCMVAFGSRAATRLEKGLNIKICRRTARDLPDSLYGWVQSADHQLFYDNHPPRRVHSFDHGLFLPGGQNWCIASLSAPGVPQPDPYICNPCGFTESELKSARDRLSELSTETIASAIAAIPPEWSVAQADKVALAGYLDARCTALRS